MEWNDAKLTNELLNKCVFESENSSKLFAGKRRKGPLSIHDAHCATLWSEPEFASQFCDELLPEVANNYDTKRVEICPSVFVDDSLTKIYADAVWRIPSNVPGKAPLWLPILFEFKATIGPKDNGAIYLQILRYFANLMSAELRRSETERVPQALPKRSRS